MLTFRFITCTRVLASSFFSVFLKWANFYFSSPKFTDSFLHNLKSTVSSAFSMPIAVVSNSKLTFLDCSISIFN